MGSSAGKENKKRREAVDNAENAPTKKRFKNVNQQSGTRQISQSDNLTFGGSIGNNADEADGKCRKLSQRKVSEASARNETNAYDANENRATRSEREIMSDAVDVGNGMKIALHQPTEEVLGIDERSPNQIMKDEKAKEEEKIARDIKKENQMKTDKEKARKWKESMKVSIRKRVSHIKDMFAESVIEFETLQRAVQKMNSYKKKGEEPFALIKDEQMHAKLKSIKQEKAALLHRLSEVASARLRHNNPNIADLSDENRATKLAEKLSELYDNEWTDLFEVIKNKTKESDKDKIVAESLRDILKYCYDNCQRVAKNQLDKLFSCFIMDNSKDLHTSPKELRLRLNEFQKNTSKQSLPNIQNIIRVGLKGTGPILKDNLVVRKSSKKESYFLNSYTDLCTSITWHMQMQDPPLVLDFGTEITSVSIFRPYTVSGPVLYYVLWPAMLLHENGPIVVKGVAQFRKTNEKDEDINERTTNQPKKTSANHVKTGDAEW